MACAALRLARFNTKASTTSKSVFQGLPSPAAAAVLMGMVWMFYDQSIQGKDISFLALIITAGTGLLMVSNISYSSFKEIDFHNKVPFIGLLAVVLIFVFASIDPPKVLFSGFLIYALSGPVVSLIRKIRKRGKRAEQKEE